MVTINSSGYYSPTGTSSTTTGQGVNFKTQQANGPYGDFINNLALPQSSNVLPSSVLSDLVPQQTPNYVPQGGFQVPNLGKTQVTPVQAPKIPALADILAQTQQATNSMAPVQNFSNEIASLGQNQVQAFLNSLNPTFNMQNEQLRERTAQRGLIGAGAEEELFRRLAGEQTQQASQGVAEIMNQNQALQISELQRSQQIEETRFQNSLKLATDLGISQAEMESQFGLQLQQLAVNTDIADKNREMSAILDTQANNLQAQGLGLQAEEVRLKSVGLKIDAISRDIDAKVANSEIILKARGLWNEEMAQDLDEARTALDFQLKLASVPGLKDEERAEILRTAQAVFGEYADVLDIDSGSLQQAEANIKSEQNKKWTQNDLIQAQKLAQQSGLPVPYNVNDLDYFYTQYRNTKTPAPKNTGRSPN